jgi:hypothetical protein
MPACDIPGGEVEMAFVFGVSSRFLRLSLRSTCYPSCLLRLNFNYTHFLSRLGKSLLCHRHGGAPPLGN